MYAKTMARLDFVFGNSQVGLIDFIIHYSIFVVCVNPPFNPTPFP